MNEYKNPEEIADFLRKMKREGKAECMGTIQIPKAEIFIKDIGNSNWL